MHMANISGCDFFLLKNLGRSSFSKTASDSSNFIPKIPQAIYDTHSIVELGLSLLRILGPARALPTCAAALLLRRFLACGSSLSTAQVWHLTKLVLLMMKGNKKTIPKNFIGTMQPI
ncbi:unnamed protein product [Cuscuta epithymum]|uniref:Uncharacterized protein n=1 Tax=Cuscuta epithymum TaxID=186058 RepID=A0AAV0F6L2_9ASTE|nr:unnamed protein product [Cuscuta epithymum]